MASDLKSRRKKKQGKMAPEEDPEFQIAPMIDILLVLLVFFMSISSTEVLQTNQNIKLPVAAKAADADKKVKEGSRIVINITWMEIGGVGSIEFEERTYASPEPIMPLIRARVIKNPSATVLIRADRTVKYAYIRSIMEKLGQAGVTSITFSVQDKEGK